MNITDLAHTADIVAAIGVIGSMIFVGIQVRASTLQQQAGQWQRYAEWWHTLLTRLSDPKIATTFAKGSAGRDLEQAEFSQFFLMCRGLLIGVENLHYQFQHGLADKEVYAGFQVSVKELVLAVPGIRAMWQLTRHCYGSDFAEFMDEIVASTPIRQQSSYKKWKELVAANLSKPITGGSKN